MVTSDQLEEAAIPPEARLVGELGGFLPFAVVAVANSRGELEQFGADAGMPDSTPAGVYEFLVAALAAGASRGRFSAAALVLNAQPPLELGIPEDRSIHACIEFGGQGARGVCVPYSQGDVGEHQVGSVVRVEKKMPYFFPAENP